MQRPIVVPTVAMNYSIGEDFFLPGSSLSNGAAAMVDAVRDLLQVHGARQRSMLAMKHPIGEIILFTPTNEVKALW
jgi:hypothetical protein